MFIYPIALIAAFLFGALTDLSLVLLPPALTRFNIPLLSVAPSHVHSFASRSLRSGTFTLVNTSSTSLDDTWSNDLHYGGCVNLELSSWALPRRASVSPPAIVEPVSSALVLSATPTRHPRAVSEDPLADSASHSHATLASSLYPYLADFLVFCTWVAALYWLSLGYAIVACVFFHRLASAVNVQRMDSPWSFYSLGLLAETSCVACHCGAPGLVDPDLSNVGRIARGVRRVLVPVADPPGCVTEPERKTICERTPRGCRGGRRQHRRRNAEDLRALPDVLASIPPTPQILIEQPPPHQPVAAVPSQTPPLEEHLATGHILQTPEEDLPAAAPQDPVDVTLNLDDEWLDGGRGGEALVLGPPLRYYPIYPPPAVESATSLVPPSNPKIPPPPAIASIPQTARKIIVPVGRTYSHCDSPPSVKPAATASRRRRAPPTLAGSTVTVVPSGKLNQRARRALAARSTLGRFLQATS
ncbi:hypothetical protein FKP32DRAFT_504120 [Trametes sanguinea]|nr:hypothetical protein FKP32DRAFT_504120 [Trametes sanguinea]